MVLPARVALPAQDRHQPTFSTSSYATWADQLSAERSGPGGIDLAVARRSNDLCHANKCTNQNVDVLRSCSCRTLKLPMPWSSPTRTQQSERRASCAALHQVQD